MLVACLATFRTLFTAKTRRDEDEHYRVEEAQRDSGPQKRHIWARAKLFQDSLFSTTKTNTVLTKVTSTGDESMEYPLRDTNPYSIDSQATGGFRPDQMPKLDAHGLLGDTNNVNGHGTR